MQFSQSSCRRNRLLMQGVKSHDDNYGRKAECEGSRLDSLNTFGVEVLGVYPLVAWSSAVPLRGQNEWQPSPSENEIHQSTGSFFRIISSKIGLNGTPPITGRIRSVRRPDGFYPIPVSPGQFERLLPFGTKHRSFARIKERERSLPDDLTRINLRHFAEMLERLLRYIDGIDMAKSMVKEWQEDMEAAYSSDYYSY
jgi:hypothetical protein